MDSYFFIFRKQYELWALNSKLTSPKHSFGIYSYNEKSASRKKLGGVGGALKPAKAAKALPVDNISRIANKVDNMTIENEIGRAHV